MRLIDQQIERTVSVLLSSDLSAEALASREELEDLIFNALDEDPPNQIIVLRDNEGHLLYQNNTADSLDIELPQEKSFSMVKEEGHRIRYLTYQIPGRPVVLQVGLVLDQRELSWHRIRWQLLALFAVVALTFIALSVFLTNYLLRPVKQLALYFEHAALNPEQQKSMPTLTQNSTEFRLLAEAVRKLTDRWQNLLLHHSSMLARLIHEVRTPLTIIRNKIEMIQSGRGSPQALAQEAVDELTHLQNLTEDFTAWTKLEYSMPSDPGIHAISVRTFVESLSAIKQGPANLRLDFHVDESAKIFAKPEHLRLIIENFLKNAIRYGDPKESIALRFDEHSFEIRSYGAPVPAAVTENLGRPFNRGGDHPGSTGIGLANILSICKKYNWRLEYRREAEENVFRVFTETPPEA